MLDLGWRFLSDMRGEMRMLRRLLLAFILVGSIPLSVFAQLENCGEGSKGQLNGGTWDSETNP